MLYYDCSVFSQGFCVLAPPTLWSFVAFWSRFVRERAFVPVSLLSFFAMSNFPIFKRSYQDCVLSCFLSTFQDLGKSDRFPPSTTHFLISHSNLQIPSFSPKFEFFKNCVVIRIRDLCWMAGCRRSFSFRERKSYIDGSVFGFTWFQSFHWKRKKEKGKKLLYLTGFNSSCYAFIIYIYWIRRTFFLFE